MTITACQVSGLCGADVCCLWTICEHISSSQTAKKKNLQRPIQPPRQMFSHPIATHRHIKHKPMAKILQKEQTPIKQSWVKDGNNYIKNYLKHLKFKFIPSQLSLPFFCGAKSTGNKRKWTWLASKLFYVSIYIASYCANSYFSGNFTQTGSHTYSRDQTWLLEKNKYHRTIRFCSWLPLFLTMTTKGGNEENRDEIWQYGGCKRHILWKHATSGSWHFPVCSFSWAIVGILDRGGSDLIRSCKIFLLTPDIGWVFGEVVGYK